MNVLRCRLLCERDEPEVCQALQHAHARYGRASQGHPRRRTSHRTQRPCFRILPILQSFEQFVYVQDFTRQSIFGHSMGGHGALTIYLNSLRTGSKQYRSVSAFAPIANPINCPWGQKAFSGYLQGGIEEAKEQYDATELITKLGGKIPVHVLVDYVSILELV